MNNDFYLGLQTENEVPQVLVKLLFICKMEKEKEYLRLCGLLSIQSDIAQC